MICENGFEASTGNELTYIDDSISVIYFESFMLPSSDSNHNSNIRLNWLQLDTKKNTKPVFQIVKNVVKFLKRIAICIFISSHLDLF